jgi:hypothetical protein
MMSKQAGGPRIASESISPVWWKRQPRPEKEQRMHSETENYNAAQSATDRAICQLLAEQLDRGLPEAENKIWHGHPVWFLEGNPIVGYSKLKSCIRLLFWSGQSYTAVDQVDTGDLQRWLAKARNIQWDYKNIVRRKGRLERLK